jgi:hypothetical protein
MWRGCVHEAHTPPARLRVSQTEQTRSPQTDTLAIMSERNGDRARFQKDRKRKLLRRQRIESLRAALRKRTGQPASLPAAPGLGQAEGGPHRTGD